MSAHSPDDVGSPLPLDQISTRWTQVNNPVHFVIRYTPAIEAYLRALLRTSQDVEDALQDFLAKVLQNGFGRANPDRGRFRDYLKVAVRNAALTHLGKRKGPVTVDVDMLQDILPDDSEIEIERRWQDDWRRCLLDKVWRALERHEHSAPGNLGFTVLRLRVDRPDDDSTKLAHVVSQRIGRPLTPEAFRKQLSRARRLFAELLIQEVGSTLSEPTREAVADELAALGLMEYVREFLPALA
jgi:RNA polymerase sigma-70 factor (ECF subfamily)